MVKIIYRNYRAGDDEQLADLYNRAFQMAGFNVLRTAKNWNWRYIQSPNFEPEMIHIAENIENRKIVGALCANLIEELSFKDKKYLIGDINDVICHPSYTKRGIAKTLMENAINYLKKKKCDISMLAADDGYFPREKIYPKYGYEEVEKAFIYLNFANLFKLVKDFPGFGYLFPVLFMNSYIPRILYKFIIRFNPFFKNFSYEIIHNKKHFVYRNAANEILKKDYTGIPNFDRKRVLWSRIKVPSKKHAPTYIIVRENNQIIGCATLTHTNLYYLKYGIKLRIGFVHEILLDRSHFNTHRNLYFGYIYIIDKISKAANKRFIGISVFLASSNQHELIKALKAMRFIKFTTASIMMKPIKKTNPNLDVKKYLYLPSYLLLGLP